MTGLAFKIGGDVSGLDKAMKRAADIVASRGKEMVQTTVTIASAMDKNLSLRVLRLAITNSDQLTAGLKGVAAAAVTIGAGIALVAALGAAVRAAAEETERLTKIGDAARGAGVGTTFYQVWTQQAQKLGVETEALTRSLDKLKEASTLKLGEGDLNGDKKDVRNESPIEARLRQQVKAGNIGEVDLNRFLGASDNEQRMKVLLALMDDMMKKGRELAALDIGEKFLDPSVVDGIRRGTIELDTLRKQLEQVGAKDLRIFSDPDIQNAREMTRRLAEAGRIMDNDLKPLYDDLSRAGRDLHAVTVTWVEGLASGVRALAALYREMQNIGNFAAGNDMRPGAAAGRAAGDIFAGKPAPSPDATPGSLAARLGGDASTEAALAALAKRMNPTTIADARAQSRAMTAGFFADKSNPVPTGGNPRAVSGSSSDEDRVTQLERFTANLERTRDLAKAELDSIGKSNVEREQALQLVRAQAAAQADVKAGLRDSATLTDEEQGKILAAAEATAKWKDEATRLNDSIQFTSDLTKDALKGFISDLREGKSATEALAAAADRLVSKLADKALDGVVDGLFGKSGGGLGSLFGGLFKVGGGGVPSIASGTGGLYADGGYTGRGGRNEPAGIVHRGEVVWSQLDVARAGGVGVVEAMRRGARGYVDGGTVGSFGAGMISAGSMVPMTPPQIKAAGAGSSGAGEVKMTINVQGARGNQEIQAMVGAGVQMGLARYDATLSRTLPMRVQASSMRYG